MLKDLVARLRLDTTQFKQGLRGMEANLRETGYRMRTIGQSMSVAISAPVLGAVKAVEVAATQLDMLKKQADVANMTAQDFKILAMATDDFGIGQDKLGDILKDVNDRIGEFQQTGGGPMKDFFEQIAPKVGLTADAFRDLSGQDALQLYIASLQQAGVDQAGMTFYMEALAGDAAKLIPVFANNGRVIKDTAKRAKELGLALDDDLIANAKNVTSEFNDVKDVLGLQFQQTMIQIAPVIQSLMSSVMPVIKEAAEGLKGLADAFQQLSPGTQATIVGMVGIAAVAGPALVLFGTLTSGIGAVVGGLGALAAVAMAHPVIALITGIAAGAALIYANWDGISAWFGGLWDGVVSATKAAWDGVTGWFSGLWAGIVAGTKSAWDGTTDWFSNLWSGIKSATSVAWDAIGAVIAATVDVTKKLFWDWTPHGLIYKNWDGIAAWFSATLATLPQVFRDAWEQIKAVTAQWVDDFLKIGGDIVDGLKAGIKAKWDELTAWFDGMVSDLLSILPGQAEVHSPSKLFYRFGKWITEGLGLGLHDGVPQVTAAMQGVADSVNGDGLAKGVYKFRDAARSVFQQVAFEGKKLGDVLKSMASNWLSTQAGNLFTAGFNGLWDAIGLPTFAKGGAFQGGRVMAFANGGVVSSPTHFAMRGGLGLMGEAGPEAILPLRRGSGGRLGVEMQGGGQHITVTAYTDEGVILNIAGAAAVREVRQATPRIVQQSVAATDRAMKSTKTFGAR